MAEAPEVLIRQAQNSLASGDTKAAQADLNQLLENYPRHPQGLLRRGFVRIRLGDVEGALTDWEAAMEVDPSLLRQLDGPDFRPVVESSIESIKQRISQNSADVSLQLALGRAYSALGRYAQALGVYTSVLRTAPEEIEAGLGCAQVYVRLGQGEQALAVLQKLYELHPDSPELCWRIGKLYSHLNSVVQATRFFERAATLNPDDWRSHLELGQIFMRQGRHEQATARFQRSLQLKADCAPALVGLAECSKELYRFEAAISYYQQAVNVDPSDYKALCQMGSLCIQLGGLDLGVETLLRALDINDQDVEIYSSLAKAYEQKGDLATSARYFAKTVELNPKDYFAAYNLGIIYRSQGQILQAAEAFGSAAQLRPNDSQYQYQSSRALLELGRVEEALEAARKAVALNPHSKESQLLFGRCCLEAGRFEPAAEAFRQAVQIDAQNVEAHYQLAVALLHLQQIEDARVSFLTVLRLSPQHAPSQLGLGHVARKTSQWQTAADHYRQAIQIDLTLKSAIQELIRLYIERSQKDSINEFLRQICLSRKGDHRIPAEFLRDWLEALEANQEYSMAEESLEFVLNLHPTSPQAKENQSAFYNRACEHFLNKTQADQADHYYQLLHRYCPQDPELKDFQNRLQQLRNPSPVPSALADELFSQPADEAIQAQAPLPPRSTPSRGLAAPPTFVDETPEPARQGLAPRQSLAPPPPLEGIVTSVRRLDPPPLADLQGSDETFESSAPAATLWPPTQISRLTLEDIGPGQNPLEGLSDLAQHYTDFALHLESCGWLRQASLSLAEARALQPEEPSLVEHQARIFENWADRLESEGDTVGTEALRRLARTLLEALLEMSPAQKAEETEAAGLEQVPSSPPPSLFKAPEDLPFEIAAQPQPRVPPTPLAPVPPTPLVPEPAAKEPEPVQSEPAPVEPEPAPVEPEPAPPPPEPESEVEETFQPEASPSPAEPLALNQHSVPAEAPETEAEAAQEDSGSIVEWMLSFQEPEAVPPAEPEPEPEVEVELEEEAPVAYRSSEFDIHLRGDETLEELLPLLSRSPDEAKVRKAIYRLLAEDVPALLKVFREMTQDDPEEPYHVLNLARAYSHTGSDSLAVLQYRKYVKMDATSEGYRELGELYEKMGKAELASQALRRASQLAEQEEAD